ncbi:unnamed protein product [Linum trigynum]|uniref:Uncharacterized protein n=1 Tax=Linum trigynum TaxID=586398 RepID=A0AAV2CJZ3_9ROSI
MTSVTSASPIFPMTNDGDIGRIPRQLRQGQTRTSRANSGDGGRARGFGTDLLSPSSMAIDLLAPSSTAVGRATTKVEKSCFVNQIFTIPDYGDGAKCYKNLI